MYYIDKIPIKLLDPKDFGLGSRTLIGKTDEGKIILIKDRQSRIIMKDGRKIIDQIEAIKEVVKTANLAFATQAPICSKTTKYFSDKGIKVFLLEK